MPKDEAVQSDEIPGGWATVRCEVLNDYFYITQFGRTKRPSVVMLDHKQVEALIKFWEKVKPDKPKFGVF